MREEKWETYDPEWLIELAKRELPSEVWLHKALASCTRCRRESAAYIYFVDARHANVNGSEWQFEKNILLESSTEGTIVLDVLTDSRIGGVEFVSKIK